ncbi:hypothetical protein ACGRHY_07715 [Streptomyces sp. HK10]|uniref:hypothetical protein n=1 Tax=Streptomyces sp. HK10 TaxID=3373255 RepID=UPI00374879EE
MRRLTDYVFAVRATDAPPAPPGLETVEIAWGPGTDGAEDPAEAVLDALRDSELSWEDQRSRTVFLAPPGSSGLVPYAAVHGFFARWIDVHVDGVLLELSEVNTERVGPGGPGTPDGTLKWAQLGGPRCEGVRWVPYAPASDGTLAPAAARTVRSARRLRMVPPDRGADAFTMLARAGRLRRRGDRWRLPFLSTGTEPVPAGKDDPFQGIDLEGIRMRADAHRTESRRSDRPVPDVARPAPVSRLGQRIAEANTVPVRSLLPGLGSCSDGGGRWSCPRDTGDHPEDLPLRLHGDNLVRCPRCDSKEKVGPVRLTAEAFGVTPDQAAAYILDGAAADPLVPGAAVVAHVVGVEPAGFECRIRQPGTGREHRATLSAVDLLKIRDFRKRSLRAGDSVTALVLPGRRPHGPDGAARLSPTAPKLVERILAGYVPELTAGRVRVMRTVRRAGARTKVVVAGTTRADARGAFIGKDRKRILCVREILNRGLTEEKIDIVEYAADPATSLAFAMAPAKVSPADVIVERGCAVVMVPLHQMDNAIGEGGLNVELAGLLAGLYTRVVRKGDDPRPVLDRLIAERH